METLTEIGLLTASAIKVVKKLHRLAIQRAHAMVASKRRLERETKQRPKPP